jgi:hypothetical protein
MMIGRIAPGRCRQSLVKKKLARMVMVMVMVGIVALAGVTMMSPAWGAGDPLLEVLIRKGVLTPEEASQIQKEARQLEKEREKQVDQKVTATEQKVTDEVDKKVAAVEKKVEKKAADWKLPEPLKGLKVGVLAYVDYSVGNQPIFFRPNPTAAWNGSTPYTRTRGHVGWNDFRLTRGYLNIEKEITPWLYARYTPDIYQDTTGDWKLRQKYLYAELRPPNLGKVLTNMKSEIGMGHIPWLDFEEHINPYRCQGTMPIERAGLINSADLGVSLRGYFGGRLANAKEVIGDEHYDGRYGSWHIGVYNGSGYHAAENNENKPVEYRATVRPLPDYLPGLQASYFGLYGKGNASSATRYGSPFANFYPDWIVHLGFLSYQHPWFTLTAQTYGAKGNQTGTWTTQVNMPLSGGWFGTGRRANSLWTRGYSIFGDVKVPVKIMNDYRLHAFYRTDWFNADSAKEIARSAKYTKLITGLAYHIYKNNMLLLVYEKTWYGRDYGAANGTGYNGTSSTVVSRLTNGAYPGDDERFQMVFQISY